MIVLFDSAGMDVVLTFVDGGNRTDYKWAAGRTLARELLGFLNQKLADNGKSINDITGIGVLKGPGSYTGLRIGLSVFNTLADAKAIPIVGATGDNWQDACLTRLSSGENDGIVLPEYGGEAHVTVPRK